MATYTVRSGDTLSGIASKLGLSSYNALSGYKSGNPNIIMPGEVLSYGGSTPKKTAAPAKKQPAAKPAQPTAVQALSQKLSSFDKNMQNPVDIYNKALADLGITDARTQVTNLRQALINNQNLLSALPGNVEQRTSDSLVTEAQRQRLVAAESEPITSQANVLTNQYGAAQQDYRDILSEGQNLTNMTVEGQNTARKALMDRLQLAIDNAKTKEEKRRWQAEFNRQKKIDAQNQSNWQKQYNLSLSKAASSGGSSGGSSRRSSGSSKSSSSKPTVENLFSGYDPGKDQWYTEKVVIPQLQKTYGYSKAQAATIAYKYRKKTFGE